MTEKNPRQEQIAQYIIGKYFYAGRMNVLSESRDDLCCVWTF
jgi:hypothetical protein